MEYCIIKPFFSQRFKRIEWKFPIYIVLTFIDLSFTLRLFFLSCAAPSARFAACRRSTSYCQPQHQNLDESFARLEGNAAGMEKGEGGNRDRTDGGLRDI
jgi:hypothetical protein